MANDSEAKAMNLNEPFFILYLDVDGMSQQLIDEYTSQCSKTLSHQGIISFVIPVRNQETKFECVWKGSKEDPQNFDFMVEKMNKLFKMMSDGIDNDTITKKVRQFTLENILNE